MKQENEKISLIEHLEELRRRIIICLIALAVTSVAAFTFVEHIRAILLAPAGDLQLIYIAPPEALLANIRLAVLAGIIMAMPVFIYQFLAFIMPALYKKEKKVFLPAVAAMLVMFAVGILFAYTVAFPFAIRFFLGFAAPDLAAMFTITRYLSFVTRFLLVFGIVFQLPLLFLLLGVLNIVDTGFLRKNRKYVVLGVAVGSALITPPDIISQLFLIGPLWLLYEAGILLVAIVQFRRKKRKETGS